MPCMAGKQLLLHNLFCGHMLVANMDEELPIGDMIDI